MKRSPQTRGSTICRSRRPGTIVPPAAAMIAPDPDLLIPVRAPYPCEEEGVFLKSLKKQSSQEIVSDTEFMTSSPLGKMFPCPTVDSSSPKLDHDETELFLDTSITKSKEIEAVVESPVRKMSAEELEDCRKMQDASSETSFLKMSKDALFIEAMSRKVPKDKREVPVDATVRKLLSKEFDAEFSGRKVERDTMGDPIDVASRNKYRERSDLPLDTRKLIWNELEATTDVSRRMISRDMMGASMDSASRKMIRDDVEHSFYSVPRRITRDSMGTSFDTGSRKFPWNNEDCQLDSSVRALSMDQMFDAAGTPTRKLSRDELEYFTDTASANLLLRKRFDAHTNSSSSTEKQDFGLGPSTSRRLLRDELESAGSLNRRIPRTPSVDSDTSTDTAIENISWDIVDDPMEIPKQSTLQEELGASSYPGRIGQPDLTVTSQVPWDSSSDLYAGPLSQLVYDGILEKSCHSGTTSHTGPSASMPNLSQSRSLVEEEPLLPSSRLSFRSPALPPEAGDEKSKHKEKSKKSLRLKNLFKKKSESPPEKPQGGLQKL